MRYQVDVVGEVQKCALRARHRAGSDLADLCTEPFEVGDRLAVPPHDQVLLVDGLGELGLEPIASELVDQELAQEVVKCLPLL
jgi:hypothetical protein